MDVRLLGWIGLRDRHSWWWAAPRNVSRQRSDMDHAGLPICAKRGRFSSHRRVMTDKQKILIGLSLLGLGILFFMKRREISDLASAALDSANDELFRLSLPSSAQPYASIIKRVSSETGMDPFILAAIGERESRWGNALHPRGPAGTGDNGYGHGLMQIDSRTWSSMRARGAPGSGATTGLTPTRTCGRVPRSSPRTWTTSRTKVWKATSRSRPPSPRTTMALETCGRTSRPASRQTWPQQGGTTRPTCGER